MVSKSMQENYGSIKVSKSMQLKNIAYWNQWDICITPIGFL